MSGWSWGAFALTWIWLLAHRLTLWGLLALLAWLLGGVLALPVAIYLGVKGNELAWTHRPFRDLAHFRATEGHWRAWGIAIFLVWGVFILAVVVISVILFAEAAASKGAY